VKEPTPAAEVAAPAADLLTITPAEMLTAAPCCWWC